MLPTKKKKNKFSGAPRVGKKRKPPINADRRKDANHRNEATKPAFPPNKKFRPNPKNNAYSDESESNLRSSNEHSSRNLIVKPGIRWFEQRPNDPIKDPVMDTGVVNSLRSEAESLLKWDMIQYEKFLEKREERSDFRWMKTILKSGTLSDKVSAHTLLIQDSSVHNMSSIEALVGMINTKGKRECLMAMDCLKDLFISHILLKGKKLKTFPQQPLLDLDKLTSGNILMRKRRLLLWLFEEKMKDLYQTFVKNLELVSRDTVEKTKQKSVTILFELIRDNSEQEQFLLEHLVNKIGDPIPKVGSHVCHLLGQLTEKHPNMMGVIVQEVERVLFRPNVADRAKYYCLCFLNQLILSHEVEHIANHLITMYFGLFKACVKKGEVDNKMMSALLTGVTRAYPYTKLKNDVIMEQLDGMFRLVHMVSFNISVQALMLIFQVLNSKDSVSDRFYSALYRKLLDPALASSSRQTLLLNLLFKSLKKDVSGIRVKTFVKRLLQVALYQPPNFQCGILMLISELAKTHMNLFESKQSVADFDSDSDEHFDDVPDEDKATTTNNTAAPSGSQGGSSWVHRESNKTNRQATIYDPQNRNPLHAGSEFTQLWELGLLKGNFHPSVTLFAHQVANSQTINYGGDPLTDFTLIRFLDRFVYRNPKNLSESVKKSSHRKVFGRKVKSHAELHPVPIESHMYIQQKEEKIPVDERFIYKYLRQRADNNRKKDFDIESVESDEFEDILDNVHAEDESKIALDFARELSINKGNKSKGKVQAESESDEEDLLGESDLEEEEMSFDEDDKDFEDAFGNVEDLESLDQTEQEADLIDDEDFIDEPQSKRKSSKKQKDEDLFAYADEFSTLLEENAEGKADALSSEAFVNYDKSAVKQLAWERERDQYVRGTDWKSRKKNSKRNFQVRKKKRR